MYTVSVGDFDFDRYFNMLPDGAGIPVNRYATAIISDLSEYALFEAIAQQVMRHKICHAAELVVFMGDKLLPTGPDQPDTNNLLGIADGLSNLAGSVVSVFPDNLDQIRDWLPPRDFDKDVFVGSTILEMLEDGNVDCSKFIEVPVLDEYMIITPKGNVDCFFDKEAAVETVHLPAYTETDEETGEILTRPERVLTKTYIDLGIRLRDGGANTVAIKFLKD